MACLYVNNFLWLLGFSLRAFVNHFDFNEFFCWKENFWDTSHAKLIIGNKILNSIHSENLEFGEIVTPENVHQHNQNISKQREIWRKNHLEELRQVQTKDYLNQK